MSFLIAFIQQIIDWLATFLEGLPLYILSLFLDGVAAFLNWLPAPSFLTSAAGWIGSIPNAPAYYLQGFNITAGFAMIVSALSLRFLIRRIPFFG